MVMKREERLQSEIVQALRENGLTPVHIPNGSDNESARKLHGKLGVLIGIPDLLVLGDNNNVCFLEVKTEWGTLSEIQEYVHADLKVKGFDVYVVRSVIEALDVCYESLRPLSPQEIERITG